MRRLKMAWKSFGAIHMNPCSLWAGSTNGILHCKIEPITCKLCTNLGHDSGPKTISSWITSSMAKLWNRMTVWLRGSNRWPSMVLRWSKMLHHTRMCVEIWPIGLVSFGKPITARSLSSKWGRTQATWHICRLHCKCTLIYRTTTTNRVWIYCIASSSRHRRVHSIYSPTVSMWSNAWNANIQNFIKRWRKHWSIGAIMAKRMVIAFRKSIGRRSSGTTHFTSITFEKSLPNINQFSAF